MDTARKRTDKMLADLERRVGEVYATDSSLLRIQKKYEHYMRQVERATRSEYLAYIRASEEDKEEKKKAYTKHFRELTAGNRTYQALTSEITKILAQVNQKALDLINNEMTEAYTVSYNQLAVDCKKEGIKVNG